MEDKNLIVELKNGSESAFSKIYDRYWFHIFHFASLYISNKEEVREIVQDIFVRLWESRRLLKEDENFKGYLFIITRNHIFNKSKSIYFNYDFYQITIDNALEYSYRIEDELDAKELEKQINILISEMPLQRQTVFTMSRKFYKTYKEIATELGISEKTVERHINEAIKYIKSNLHLLAIFLSVQLF